MRKIAVVMTYYNRENQLRKTLETISETAHTDYEIVIVDDASEQPIKNLLRGPGINHVRIEPEDKTWTCPVVPYNMGILVALRNFSPDIVVIQNAECYHVSDVLMYANDHLANGNYISFACWNESRGSTDVFREIAQDDPLRTDGGTTGWYNHPVNARAFHFCNAYNAEDMRELNGFDERFKDGAGCDDDDLVRRLRALGRSIAFTDETLPFVVHQWHSRSHLNQEMYDRNQIVCSQIAREPGHRAQHIVTEDF